MDNQLLTLSNEITGLVETASPYVVAIHGRGRHGAAAIHWQPGVAVTAAHAIEGEDEVALTLPDGSRTKASVVGRDESIDVAALRLPVGGLALPKAATGPFRTGELALAVGRVGEGGTTAQLGVLSVIPSPWRTWKGGSLDVRLRLDFALSPSGSGCAALDAAGRVIGMATNGLSRFAALVIPAQTIDSTLTHLLTKGHVPKGFLGVALQRVAVRDHPSGQKAGLILLSVEPESPAAHAGLFVGDVLLSIDGHGLDDAGALQSQLAAESIGTARTVRFLRGGKEQEAQVTIGERP